ncbi:MAG: hypothetical protein R2912_05820 [Eubacteriales bacterium]
MNLEAAASFGETMRILGLGMLGIFIVTAAVIIVITLLNLITETVKNRKRS